MTVRPAIVLSRLRHLARVLEELERIARLPKDQRSNFTIELAAERALHVAAEAIFDLGHHILSGRGLPVPATYREVPPALVSAGVFSQATADRLAGLAGLRNLLVHDYGDVDKTRLWAMIDTRLSDLGAARDALAAIPELARID